MTGALTVSIPDDGGAPGMSNTLRLKGYEGRGAGIKIQDSVNSASNASSREWFIGSGYAQSGFNIGYSSTGSQSSYSAQNKLSIDTSGNATFAGTVNGRNLTTDGNKLDDIHADLLNVSSSGTGALDLELLKADTIIANHITANTIDANHLRVSNNAAGSAGIYMDGANNRIDIRDASALRVRIGYLGS